MRVKEIYWFVNNDLVYKEVPVSGVSILIPSAGDTVYINKCDFTVTRIEWVPLKGVVKIIAKS